MIVPFVLNGELVYIDANPGERLVQILRRRFGLLNAKEGCFSGRCGSCMVLMNDEPVPSCLVPVFQVKNNTVITLEHFSKTKEYREIMEGFESAGITMCGFCNAGKIFITHAILQKYTRPSNDEIRAMFVGNICRCTDIESLIAGVRNAGAMQRRRRNAK
ncbi:MAG TPA: 2Fe-2S iron-sulfur cluster binding domain-containing protein [Treponema sp.]|nr:2Fe-2S iron-sulfur cluster binding domain-containing protein [Treponema sp.]